MRAADVICGTSSLPCSVQTRATLRNARLRFVKRQASSFIASEG